MLLGFGALFVVVTLWTFRADQQKEDLAAE